MRYDLVIFDNDGVLVDSESLSNTILAGYLTELGHPTSYEESIVFMSSSWSVRAGGCPRTSTRFSMAGSSRRSNGSCCRWPG
ncbi:hypothetical protein SAMN06272775_3777 [Streptomyces sp. 2323.1]|nr:hypothetical protein SAMN06272775_3777 [Streptomyces sp. 2323.1]